MPSSEATHLPAPPRPLPAVPCLVYDGSRVRWDRWEAAPRVLCAKLDQSCEACRDPGPASISRGVLDVPERTVIERRPLKRRPGRPREWADATRTVKAHRHWRLMAFLCTRCGHLGVLDHGAGVVDAPEAWRAAEMVLCDGCDAVCGVGVDLVEARVNLVALGGWTGGEGSDWDLCPACNPASASEPPPRALAAYRAPAH